MGGISSRVSDVRRMTRGRAELATATPSCGRESRVKAGRGGGSALFDLLDDRRRGRGFKFLADAPSDGGWSRVGFGATSNNRLEFGPRRELGLGFRSLTSRVRDGAAAAVISVNI